MPKRLTPRGEAAPPVEPIVTGATLPPKPASRKRTTTPKPKATGQTDFGVRYVYNLRAIPCRVTLATGREIYLEPRGQRGDLDIVNVDEQQDPRYLANKDLLFQVITPAQAEGIIAGQQTNAKTAEHPAWAHLRNAQDKPYEQRHTHIEEAFERQGVVVGHVAETGAGRFTDKNFEVSRAQGASPEIVTRPGSPGDPATSLMNTIPADVQPGEYHEFLLWKQFRAQQEAEALRAELAVTIEPTEVEDAE